MANVECKNAQEARDLLRHCLDEGRIWPSRHFFDELANEKLDLEDAIAVLRAGQVLEGPDQDPKTLEWKWKVEGREPGGKWIVIVVVFKTVDLAKLITVFEIGLRRIYS